MKMKRSGWTGLGLLAVILAASIGGLTAHYIVMSADRSSAPIVQWGLLTIFLLPIGFAMQLWHILGSVSDTKGLSGSEKRRLESTIEGKSRQLQIAVMFYVVAAALIALGLLKSPDNWFIYQLVTIFTGMCLGISIASIFLILQEWREIAAFKRKISARQSRAKAVGKKLERLR